MRLISQAGGITRQTKGRVRVDGGQPRARGGRHVLQSKAKVIAWKKRRCCLASERETKSDREGSVWQGEKGRM